MSGNTNEREKELSLFLHNVYNNDPLVFKSYVNKRISVITEDGGVQSGIVYTVDPVSESIVLLEPKENQKYELRIILGHAIKSIEVSPDPLTIIPELFKAPEVSGPVSAKQKEAVKRVLLENRFPIVEKDGVLCIKDIIRVEPPYKPENCISTNSIILSRIQKIISDVTL